MIETIEIKNYQPHKHTVLELSPGVNVIKGSSHGGKSSIWRAIRWALMNRPLGESFKSTFADKNDEVSVGIEFSDGFVYRRRGPNKNEYEVSGIDGPLQAVRTDIPKEVNDVTKMGEVNLHGQDSRYFLLQETPGKIAEELNKIAGLEIIGEVLKRAKKIISDTEIKIKMIVEDRNKKSEELLKYKYLEKVEPIVVHIKENYIEFNNQMSKVLILKESLDKVSGYKNNIKEITNWLKVKEKFDALKNRIGMYKEKEEQLRQLKNAVNTIKDLTFVKNSLDEHVKKLQSKYDNLLKSEGVCPLCKRPW